ncbi:MAG: DUF2752 domain-containing protein [Tenacibaculum sp.]|nr:DUF2752 domain-containing protein [Tenacibaculum sp.]
MKLEDYMLPCLNKKIFDVDCPGCGLQRSFIHLIKGDVYSAYDMYPPLFTLLILVGFIFLNLKFKFKNGSKIITILAVLNAMIIMVNYYFKMRYLFNN